MSDSIPKSITEWSALNLPDWLANSGPLGAFVGLCLIMPQDVIYQAMSEALWNRYQKEQTSPDDILPVLGQEANLPRYQTEDNDTYRSRINGKWKTWRGVGTFDTLREQLGRIGFSDVQFVLDLPGGGNYDDGSNIASYPPSSEWWSQFLLRINLTAAVGSGAEGRSVLISDSQLQDIRFVLAKFKDAQWRCAEIVISSPLGGDRYDTGIGYDTGDTYDGVATGVLERFHS